MIKTILTRYVYKVCTTFILSLSLIFLLSGTGMAVIAEGDFDGLDTTSLRANGSGQDWYESRLDDPTQLVHITNNIGGHTSQAMLITSNVLEREAYLSQDFSSPVTGISEFEWNIYVDSIFNNIDGTPDRAGFMFIGNDSNTITPGPNSNENERFVCMAFLKDGGGSDGTMELVAQDNNSDWLPIIENLGLDAWHKIKVRCYFDEDEYNVYVDDIFTLAVPARNEDLSSLTHISFGHLSNGMGTFYIDDVSQTDFYTLSSTVVGQGTVQANPEGEMHDHDIGMTLYDTESETTVTLTATPEPDWVFSEWSGDASGEENEVAITMDSDKNVTATFLETFDLNVTPVGNGTVSLDPSTGPYADGTLVTLTPNGETGWEFVRWEGDLTGNDNPAAITMESDMNVTAVFELMTYDLSINVSGDGTTAIDPPTGPYEHGTTVTISATPETGRRFTGWTGDITDTNPEVIILMDGEKNVTANFENITYTVAFTAGDNGQVTGDPLQTVEHGGSTTLVRAEPANEYNFVDWSGDYSGNINPLAITNVISDMNIAANFAINMYSVFFIASNGGSVLGDTNQTVTSGDNCSSVTAVPGEGYHFINWSGDVDSDANPLTISNVTSNMTITANFEINTYTVNFLPGDHGGLNGDISQTINHGSTCATVTAYPAEGYQFAGWTGDYAGDDNPLTLENVTSNMTITAGYVLSFDGNSDGTPDEQQDHIRNLTALNQEIVTVEFSGTPTILECGAVDDPSPDDRPAQYDFDYGLIRFVIDDVETGGATTVTIHLPEGAAPVTYFKYGRTLRAPSPHWYEFMYDGTTGAEIDGNIITLHFVDGERGDDDLSANGKIEDDGGPGFSDIPVTPDADGSGDSQGASGGCFISELKPPVIVD